PVTQYLRAPPWAVGRHSDGTALSKPRKPGRNGEGGCYCLSVCAGLKEAPSGFSSYQHTFDEFLERGKQLKNYRANVIANVNNCLSFRTSMEQKWQIPQNPSSHLLDPLNELKGHSFDILLQNLFVDLKRELVEKASGPAGMLSWLLSCSWMTLEKSTQSLPPLPVCERGT
uniref:Uncharacterized protein n=1 Tax=Castor canadensis TaxID=51338 RepID=A0A8C0XK57_CASCN